VIPASAVSAFVAAVHAADRICIGSHVDPDGDAIGSMLGLTLALRSVGIHATPLLAGGQSAPVTYTFLPGSSLLVSAENAGGCDLFIALDAPSAQRLGETQSLAESARTLIIMDHHPDGDGSGDLRIIAPDAPATGALVWELLPALGVTPDADIATCLYTALLTDTGRYSYSNTDPAALRLGADMIEVGVDVIAVHTAVYESRSAAALALMGRTLARITLADGGRVAYSWVEADDFAETGARLEETENLIDFVRMLDTAEVVFLLKIHPGEVRVSLRAKGSADVGAVARRLGGGGHAAAAGFTFTGTPSELLEVLLPVLAESL
jgi:phosphoesterase RecJ-like protein